MVVVMRHHPSYGLAIYDAASWPPEDGPLVAPLDNVANGKLRFHGALKYTSLGTPPPDVTVALPATPGGNQVYSTGIFILGAHGKGSPPIPRAQIVAIDGSPASIPLNGTVAVQVNGKFPRCVEIATNSTHVALIYRGHCPATVVGVSAFPAITLTIRYWVLDWTVDGQPTLFDATQPLLKKTGTRITIGRGMFDTNRHYIRCDLSGGGENAVMTNGPTWQLAGAVVQGNASPTWGWRYSCNGVTATGQGSVAAFSPATKAVKLP